LADGQTEMQIAYSSGFTALSFFVPIMVLLGAFVAVGTNNKVSWWRITGGGFIAGAAICGMHYLGNASIDNYSCNYNPVNVVGAALIAVAASIVALSLFFVFRASWTNSWWKRGISSIVLAGAVSGMHWTASTGTQYRLIRLNVETNQLSRNVTVIVVICLSVGAALIMAGTAMYTTHIMRGYASKAQQVVLAAAVFDKAGRILVNPDGLLPSEKITDTYLEKTPSDMFSIAHPLFHWMFQASRNWVGMSNVIQGMRNHLGRLPRNGRDPNVRLIDENGQLVESYDIIFRELFCVAAANLADKMKEHITNVGVLWDEILPTGAGSFQRRRIQDIDGTLEKGDRGSTPSRAGDSLAEKGENWRTRQQEYGRGSLMFLVRRLDNSRDVEKLEAAGFRFAEVTQVSGIIGNSMQIKSRNLVSKLTNMAAYGDENTMLEPGVHLGFFGIKARVGSYGFDILARRGARNLLPSMPLPMQNLESWQMDFLRELDRLTVPALCQKLESMKKSLPREMLLASQFYDTIESLRAWIDDPIFDEAMLTSRVVQVPCRTVAGSSSASTCTMVTLRMVIPIHVNVQSPRCEFVPLNFFKVHQLVYKDSPQHAAFSRSVHREITPIINAAPLAVPAAALGKGRHSSFRSSRFGFKKGFRSSSAPIYPVDADGNPIPTEFGPKSSVGSNHSSSTLKLWTGSSNERRSATGDTVSDRSLAHRSEAQQLGTFGGIMVSQEIQVDVRDADSDRAFRNSRQPGNANRLSDQNTGKSNGDRVITVASSGFKKDDTSAQAIEMKRMPEGIHSGSLAMLGSATAESENTIEVKTFVDELFAVCVEGR
jgi:NO-binding membrane sensor protein with MHYT domain